MADGLGRIVDPYGRLRCGPGLFQHFWIDFTETAECCGDLPIRKKNPNMMGIQTIMLGPRGLE
jgi:hypothetical protein